MKEVIAFRYTYQHQDTGRIVSKHYTIHEIEQGQIMIYPEWVIIARDRFIGLVDKNDNDIYENDILKYDGEKETCEECGHVTWRYTDHKPYLVKWELSAFTCENNENWMAPEEYKNMEIIGNTFLNPELLRKEK